MSADTPTDTDEPQMDDDATESESRKEEHSLADLQARIDLLEAENQRLRAEYARSKRSQYRETAIGLAAIGTVATLGAVVFPASGQVLFSLGAIGFFAALLTYYLTPERFVAATVGEAVYMAHAEHGEAVVSELGLCEQRLYVPIEEQPRPATLFIPQNEDDPLPTDADLETTFVVGEEGDRGVSLWPVGGTLFEEFERALSGPLAPDPRPLADQLADGIREAFELADGVEISVATDGSQCTFGIDGSALGPVDRFDHPIASFLAVGLAVGLDRPVEVSVTTEGERHDNRVICSWEVISESE